MATGAKVQVERPVVIYEFRTPAGVQGFTLRPDLHDGITELDTAWRIDQPRLREVTMVYKAHVLVSTRREATVKVMEPMPVVTEDTNAS